MDKHVEHMLLIFRDLDDHQKREFLEELEKYIKEISSGEGETRSSRLHRVNEIMFGPSPSGRCPTCGK